MHGRLELVVVVVTVLTVIGADQVAPKSFDCANMMSRLVGAGRVVGVGDVDDAGLCRTCDNTREPARPEPAPPFVRVKPRPPFTPVAISVATVIVAPKVTPPSVDRLVRIVCGLPPCYQKTLTLWSALTTTNAPPWLPETIVRDGAKVLPPSVERVKTTPAAPPKSRVMT